MHFRARIKIQPLHLAPRRPGLRDSHRMPNDYPASWVKWITASLAMKLPRHNEEHVAHAFIPRAKSQEP